jgi:uncharacterized protein
MLPGSYQQLVPTWHIEINGRELPFEIDRQIVSLTIQEELFAPAMLDLRLHNFQRDTASPPLIDDHLFDVGQSLQIRLGYEHDSVVLETLFFGEITGLEAEYAAQTAPLFIVRGYDYLHRLTRGQRTRSFVQMKDSDIAAQLARENGLQAEISDSEVILAYVMQQNQTDLAFLQERAARIGYEVAVRERSLLFRPYRNAESPAKSLQLEGLRDLRFVVSALGPVEQIEIRGWDPQNKQEIVAHADAGSLSSRMGGTQSGAEVGRAFGERSTAVIVDTPMFNQAEAEQIARGQFNTMALEYVTVEGQVYGQADLHSGMVIEIPAHSRRFQGLYYLTETSHSVDTNRGYFTSFVGRRNAT